MPGRQFNVNAYRYGFNTQEKTDEITGAGNHYTAEFWEYDTRVIQRWNVDPKSSPSFSSYLINANNPIVFNDPKGDCPPGIDCSDPLPIMRIRTNRASNLGPGDLRSDGTKFHAGHDLTATSGTPVFTVMTGKVIAAGYSSSYGNYVTIAHFKQLTPTQIEMAEDPKRVHLVKPEIAYYSFYAHLSVQDVKTDDYVVKGQQIGETGITGNADAAEPHLHFEIGTATRTAGSPFLKKSALANPNLAYKTVNLRSADPDKNQTNTSVIREQLYKGGSNIYIDKVGTNKSEFIPQFEKPKKE